MLPERYDSTPRSLPPELQRLLSHFPHVSHADAQRLLLHLRLCRRQAGVAVTSDLPVISFQQQQLPLKSHILLDMSAAPLSSA